MSTLITFGLLGLLTAAEWFLWVVLLRFGLSWAKVEGVTIGRVIGALLLSKVGQGLVFVLDSQWDDHQRLLTVLLISFATFVLPCVVVAFWFRLKPLRSIQAWLPTMVVPVITIPFAYMIGRFLIEAFVLTSNSMAPTLLGPHLTGLCVRCDGKCFASYNDLEYLKAGLQTQAICTDFHVTQTDDVADLGESADRIMVAKYLSPERWDMVAFKVPEDPSTIYVMRLVGLPGEEIVIKDGKVLADSRELIPPNELAKVEYITDTNGEQDWPANWGSPESPAQLADGEYFVLGDFSARSRDSRLWVKGAPGHDPYAVPESYIVGVVTCCYWPPDRWRTFR
ncbi:MAG: signal peptidase I [Planctomycetaceae bacterium]|nr:signal peptidase I [Planctomycetaceae bacterium]